MKPIDALAAATAAVQTVQSHDGFGLHDQVELDDESFTNIDEDKVLRTQIEDLSPEELAARAILAVKDVEAEVAAGTMKKKIRMASPYLAMKQKKQRKRCSKKRK